MLPDPEKVTDPGAEVPIVVSVADLVHLELQRPREQLLCFEGNFNSDRRCASRDRDDLY
jgi:hypothetical protein